MDVRFHYFDDEEAFSVNGNPIDTLAADRLAGGADNDADGVVTSAALLGIAGSDVPDMGGGESILLVIDRNFS